MSNHNKELQAQHFHSKFHGSLLITFGLRCASDQNECVHISVDGELRGAEPSAGDGAEAPEMLGE